MKTKTIKNYYLNPVSAGNGDMYAIPKPSIEIELPFLGSVKPKSTDEIQNSNWFLGCETIDRDFADYQQYKEYLRPLGIKFLRFQGGWAKTEKKQGVYNWKWLDEIIDDAVAKGLKPWIETGYGNTIYPDAGGENLGAGIPVSEEGLKAYDKWVAAMVTRYRGKVQDWEVWNEPNFGDNTINTPEMTADFNLRTARIIKEIQPEARISALALGHINLEFVEKFFKRLSEREGCGLFHNVTYHDYFYNPDANNWAVDKLRHIVERYAPDLILRQGENGAPSIGNSGGALAEHDWSELSQAKWDIRRMLGNLGNDIECSVYSIVEIQYTGDGPIRKKNSKGLLKSEADNTVTGPKIAYFAVQNVTAIFDDRLTRLKDVEKLQNIKAGHFNECWIDTDRSIAVYGYEEKHTHERIYTIWRDEAIPGNSQKADYYKMAFKNSRFAHPVVVDMITGNVYEIPQEEWEKEGDIDYFHKIPVYDSPILIAEQSLIILS